MMFAQTNTPRIAVCATLTFLALVTVLSPPAAAQGQPKISIEPTYLDFGLMQQRQAENATIMITNEGDADLVLGEVEVTCGCTAAEPASKLLKPGQSTELAVTFNSQTFGGETIKYIKINSNDPFNSVIDVTVHANVHVALFVEPSWESVSFKAVRAGSTKERVLTFSTGDVPDLQVTATRYSEDLFDVVVSDSETGDPQEKLVSISVRSDARIGTFREALNFETNVPNRLKLHIEATGRIVAPIAVKPDKVNLRYLQRNQSVSRIFTVSYEKGMEFNVTRATIDLPGFTVKEIAHDTEKSLVMITIEGVPISVSDERAKSSEGRMKGTLRMFTNLKAYPELTASVMYLLKL